MRDREPTVRSRELGEGLRRAMERARLNGKQVVHQLDWSPSWVSRLLSGKRSASQLHVAAILGLCRVTGAERERLLALCQNQHTPGWLQQHGSRLPKPLRTLIDHEDKAVAISDFQAMMVPGLLQTGDYARAVIRDPRTVPADEIEDRVAARLARQRLFSRERPARFTFFIHEFVLRLPVGGPAVMSDQLHHLLRVSVRPLASGAIGTGQLKVITEAMAALPSTVSQDDRDWAEATLAEHAQNFDLPRLRVIARRVIDQLDPDGPSPGDEPDDACPAAGELHIRDRRDGGITLEGWLDALHGTAFRGLIEQLAQLRPLTEDIPDPRTTAQPNADALVEIYDLARGNDQTSTAGGEPPHVTVTVDYDALIKQLSGATLDYGQRLSAGQTRLAVCDCKIIPVVMSGDSEPLDVGRAMRTVPLGIRRALVARDRGCTFPGCDRAPALCHAHHVLEWNQNGHTEVNNCILLCAVHHRWVHATGWDITIRGNLIEFRPPAILDPHRRPLHNPLRQ